VGGAAAVVVVAGQLKNKNSFLDRHILAGKKPSVECSIKLANPLVQPIMQRKDLMNQSIHHMLCDIEQYLG
jgi:hypothetical protein